MRRGATATTVAPTKPIKYHQEIVAIKLHRSLTNAIVVANQPTWERTAGHLGKIVERHKCQGTLLGPILDRQALLDIANRHLQQLKMKVDHLMFEIAWIKGKDNVKADALSRHPCAQATAKDELDKEFFTAQTAVAVNRATVA
jgi:hypothetical protein